MVCGVQIVDTARVLSSGPREHSTLVSSRMIDAMAQERSGTPTTQSTTANGAMIKKRVRVSSPGLVAPNILAISETIRCMDQAPSHGKVEQVTQVNGETIRKTVVVRWFTRIEVLMRDSGRMTSATVMERCPGRMAQSMKASLMKMFAMVKASTPGPTNVSTTATGKMESAADTERSSILMAVPTKVASKIISKMATESSSLPMVARTQAAGKTI